MLFRSVSQSRYKMSCALTAGYALGCRNSVGGVYSLSLANFNPTGSVTTNGSGTVTWLNGYGLENLLSYSQQLDFSGNGTNSWQCVSASVSANTTAAPDGTTTADTVTFSGTPLESYVRQLENLTTEPPTPILRLLKTTTLLHRGM